MKRSILSILLILAAVKAHALRFPEPAPPMLQATAHTVGVTWGASPDATSFPAITYNVYRATGACTATTFTNIGSTAAGVLALR